MSLFPSYQVVLFLLSTKDITESYTASRGPSIYSMESDPVDKDENKVELTIQPKTNTELRRNKFALADALYNKRFIFQPFQIYANTLSVAQTPVALVFCILHLHLCSTEKICCMSKLQGL